MALFILYIFGFFENTILLAMHVAPIDSTKDQRKLQNSGMTYLKIAKFWNDGAYSSCAIDGIKVVHVAVFMYMY